MGDFRIGDNGRVWSGFVEADYCTFTDYWTFCVYRVGTNLTIAMQTIAEIIDLKRYYPMKLNHLPNKHIDLKINFLPFFF